MILFSHLRIHSFIHSLFLILSASTCVWPFVKPSSWHWKFTTCSPPWIDRKSHFSSSLLRLNAVIQFESIDIQRAYLPFSTHEYVCMYVYEYKNTIAQWQWVSERPRAWQGKMPQVNIQTEFHVCYVCVSVFAFWNESGKKKENKNGGSGKLV